MTGYRMHRGAVLGFNGKVRVGGNRNEGLYERLKQGLHEKVAEAVQLDLSKVFVKLICLEYDWVVEGGMPTPAPGT